MRKRISAALLVVIALSGMPGCVPSFLSTQKTGPEHPGYRYELDSGWVCMNIKDVKSTGEELSIPRTRLSGWIPATVPGTVLTAMLNNKLIPDPFFGMNDEKIPDIYETGRDYYTYWFVKDFKENPPSGNEQVWLHFRGVNYGCDVYLNGHRLNKKTHYGMYLRQTYNITPFLTKDGNNRLAVLVYPPDPVGNPNGGQGGDGTIARSVSNQYVAGWDWIQPVRDRNTGIWDKVAIEKTNTIELKSPHVVTLVLGKRYPGEPQAPAIIRASAEIYNPTGETVRGKLQYVLEGNVVSKEVTIQPDTTMKIQLPDYTLMNPKLWWPNGYGKQSLYKLTFQFLGSGNELMDEREITMGVREIQTRWDSHTRSREVLVNGQKIFIKGGDWIVSDAMLRLSPQRYDAPEKAQVYGVPRTWRETHGVRRYGFHGSSHRYIAGRVPELLRDAPGDLRVVSCHLGGSSSICAIRGGKSVDTSMGFSPQSGLEQSSRPGNLDPFVVLHVMEKESLTPAQTARLLCKQGGLLGISGLSNDIRDLEKAAGEGHVSAALALEVLVYEVKKHIGAYAAAMGGLDAVAFAGGIGENSCRIRREVCDGLEFLGLHLDPERNRQPAQDDRVISPPGSPVTVLVIYTNEEIVVARETAKVLTLARA